MGKLVELAKITEELEANLRATVENRNAMIEVLKGKIAILERKLEFARSQIEEQETIIALLRKEKEG